MTAILQGELIRHGIGDTIFTRSRNVEKLLGFSKIYLKFEGGNPTGTMKDRAAYACLKVAKEKGYTELGIGSCGNFGASFVYLAKLFNIKPHIHIPAHYHTSRISEMEKQGGVIHRVQGTYEDAVIQSSQDCIQNGWYNANPGASLNTEASLEAYATISYEIYDRLGFCPDIVAVPVGNGTTLAGIHRGFKGLMKEGKIEWLPKIIAASTSGGNPIIYFFNRGEMKVGNLKPSEIMETEINEPLVSWISLDGQEALNALWETNGWATYVKDDEMVRFSNIVVHEEGLCVLPASCSSLAALSYYVEENEKEKGKSMVAFLTAKGH